MGGLLSFLLGGGEVAGSEHDGKVKNVTDMTDRGMKSHRYADEDGYWTPLGYRRATTEDYRRLGENKDKDHQ